MKDKLLLFCFIILAETVALVTTHVLKTVLPFWTVIFPIQIMIGFSVGYIYATVLTIQERLRITERNVGNLYEFINRSILRSIKKEFKVVQ